MLRCLSLLLGNLGLLVGVSVMMMVMLVMVLMAMLVAALLLMLMQVVGVMLLTCMERVVMMTVMVVMRLLVVISDCGQKAVCERVQLLVIELVELNHLHVHVDGNLGIGRSPGCHGLLVLLTVALQVLVGVERDDVDGSLLPRLADLFDIDESG